MNASSEYGIWNLYGTTIIYLEFQIQVKLQTRYVVKTNNTGDTSSTNLHFQLKIYG